MIGNVSIGSVTLEQAAIYGRLGALVHNFSFQGKFNDPACFFFILAWTGAPVKYLCEKARCFSQTPTGHLKGFNGNHTT